MCNIGMLSLGKTAETRLDIEEIKQKHTIIELTEELEWLETLDAVILLEENISNLSGICELISKIKKRSTCYIWVMTATENSVGKLVYLQLGADEVFDLNRQVKEIEFIMENSLRRVNDLLAQESVTSKSHSNDELLKLISNNSSVLIEGNQEIVLTKLEFQMLELLLQNLGTAVSYETIYQTLWRADTVENKQYRIANVVYHLRKKIEKNVKKPIFIKTVRSKGYMLNI
ncbi:DNA-binding response regulator [Candidatus Enterococcus ikei]|uniref:Response regulator transcription factor n=1 Tax=Candidatus Enterococcus ikei TaxID=2815326 RepID=A0ABS3H343_9ENTE|nr:winged helix-turn-helix domain-containing protein [Enterococcus sp. DIV0869a]MBO0441099.1 response regulator transcription factor [Enterococcus sp. DIV0869a]